MTWKQYELLPFGALCNLIAKTHTITTSKFWKIKFMDANFFYYSMIDLYKDNHVHVCVHLLTFSLKKTSTQKLLTGLLPNFIVFLW